MGEFDFRVVRPPSASDFIRDMKFTRQEILASDFHERLVAWIREYEAGLDPEFEVGARLVTFGQAFTFHLTSVTYWDPAMLRFDGFDHAGNPVQLIQHVTQLSVFLCKEPKRGVTAVRIGFIKEKASEDDSSKT